MSLGGIRVRKQLLELARPMLKSVDLSQVDVVTLYLLPQLNVKLIPQLEKMKPGARIVSHAFDMKGIVPDHVITYNRKRMRWSASSTSGPCRRRSSCVGDVPSN
jgi:hypothetical protein